LIAGDILALGELEAQATAPPPPKPFVNREIEIEQVAQLLLRNIACARTNVEQRSQSRMTFITCAQMFGAGKTALGVNLLPQLRKRPDLVEVLGAKNPEADIEYLMALQHVLVDLRTANTEDQARAILVRALIGVELGQLNYTVGEHPELRRALALGSMTMSRIVRAFEREFKHCYLVHLDDMGPFATDSLEKMKLFLSEVSEIQDTRPNPTSCVFASSRSPLLYLLGSKMIQSPLLDDWTSPSSAQCIVIDSLKAKHIEELLPPHSNIANAQDVSRILFDRTAGVPRFVVGAVALLRQHSEGTPHFPRSPFS
jgi:hypothetical protein